MARVAVIYYSQMGTCAALAEAVGAGAGAVGAEVRLCLVAETAPEAQIDKNAAWRAFVDRTAAQPRATVEDVVWAQGVVWGTPARFGNVASQLKAFIDSLGPLWREQALADKVYAGFTSASSLHGGHESTLLALYNTFYHFGGLIASVGYADPVVAKAGGNPYGVSAHARRPGSPLDEAVVSHAELLGAKVARLTERLVGE